MKPYIIKAVAHYEISAESHEEAIKIYKEGLWDYTDMTDEHVFELGYTDNNHEYHNITPRV